MRLIDVHKLDILGHLEEFPECESDKAWNAAVREISAYVDLATTVDAVPVVRCKDCKHLCVWNRKDIYAFCPKTNIVFLPFEKDTRTFFCSFGERKESNHEKV